MVGKNLQVIVDRAQETIKAIDSLKRGDRVFIVWHDACRVSNDPDIRPEYFGTRKDTQGIVFDCLPDPEFSDVFYLIVWGELTGKRPDYYDAIPAAWIARVQPLEPTPVKFPRKDMKVIPVARKTVDRVLVYKGGQLVEDSGGISKVPKRFESTCTPTKLVEEIYKIVAQ